MEVKCGYVSKHILQGAIKDLKENFLKRDTKQNYQVCAH